MLYLLILLTTLLFLVVAKEKKLIGRIIILDHTKHMIVQILLRRTKHSVSCTQSRIQQALLTIGQLKHLHVKFMTGSQTWFGQQLIH